MPFRRPLFDFHAGGFKLCLGVRTKIMGVLNVTPDSFSDGGVFMRPALAEIRALEIEKEGADILDIGGESSRPGAAPVSAQEEIRRIQPVLRRLKNKLKIPISVDTSKLEVAQMAFEEGAVILNDIRALAGNKKLARLAARYGVGVVLMHMQGSPRTMQARPRYRNPSMEIGRYLERAAAAALEAGIARHSLLLDPGFGFGKTLEHNAELLRNFEFFHRLKYPLLAGFSRKSFVGVLSSAGPKDRLAGSLSASAAAVLSGAHVLRVHDIRAHRELVEFLDSVFFCAKTREN